MTSLTAIKLHIHFRVSCWQGETADLVENRWKATTIATSAFHSSGSPFYKWNVRDYHLCFTWLKRRWVTDTEGNSLLSLPPQHSHQFEPSMLGIGRKREAGIKVFSSILWRADSCGVIGNEKREILSRFQPHLLGAWLDQNQRICSRPRAGLLGSWERWS